MLVEEKGGRMNKVFSAVCAIAVVMYLCLCAFFGATAGAQESSSSRTAVSSLQTGTDQSKAVKSEPVAESGAASTTALATPAMDTSLQEYEKEHPAEDASAENEILVTGVDAIIPEGMDRSVIGADNRITVDNTAVFPYCAIALMNVHMSCGHYLQGTGFMVGPNLLMTAGHCLCCTDHNGTADSIEFYFGYQSDYNYYYKYDGETSYWFGTYFNDGYTYDNMLWDYGYVKFPENIGYHTGAFGLTIAPDKDLDGGLFQVAGYRDGMLKTDIGTTNVTNQYLFHHNADTLPGNSGCPVFDANYYVVGINVASSKNDDYNTARRVTLDLFKKIYKLY